MAFGAYMMVRAWLGRKAPKLEKMLGRMSAAKFKELALGRVGKATAKEKLEFERLRAKVEAKHGKINR